MARDLARQAKEIELKLEFDPADAARLASHPALRAGPAPQEEHQPISTYFDTPDGALHKAGVYLASARTTAISCKPLRRPRARPT